MAWIRSAGLRGVRPVVEKLGGDPASLARRSGLPFEALDSDEILVHDTAIALMLEMAARELDCPDFGLRVALNQELGMLGPLAVAVQHAPTVQTALDSASRYLFVHARGLAVRLTDDPRHTRGVVGIQYGYISGTKAPPQSMDMGLLFIHRALASVVGTNYGLRSVEIPHPPAAPRDRYRELFGARVHFDQPSAMLRVSRDLLSQPVTGGDPLVRQLAMTYLQNQIPDATRPVSGKTRAVVAQSLGSNEVTVDSVANTLAMSTRSLQRHLRTEGTTFAEVVDKVRRDRTRELLQQTDLPIGRIAPMVGLNSAPTLSRYAQRWWGRTARQVRNNPYAD